ncbi:MAG TPA: glycosyltransferase family 39 protein [Bryobacteraceae bacterium]|nr:glycosyltransferase family 39 protein [Bryobacteraceae bacterium]
MRLSLLAFSLFYFADVCLRASAKYFWYDEILTLYFSRFPNLHSLWGALQTGLESNPPGFHLLTRASETVFGEGLIATRLPEIVAFWVLCLCFFKFVERRAGAPAGFIAMSLPMLTGAYFYAYEARPLIIVVAFAAIALLCWDNALGGYRDKRWLFGFSFALLTAFMLHCYAILIVIPFGIVELVRNVKNRRIDWPFWIALTAPLIPATLLYLPLLKAFRKAAQGTDFSTFYGAVWPEVIKFYGFLLLPCAAILLLALSLFARDRVMTRAATRTEISQSYFTWSDALVCLGFAALPAFGVILGQIVHSPYFGRYFLSAIIGFCIPFAITAGAGRNKRWIVPVLLCAIVFGLGVNFARLVRHRMTGTGETLEEPSTKAYLSTTAGKPLNSYPLVTHLDGDSKPIAVLEPTDFLYLLQYAPQLASRLYYIHSSDRDESFRGLRAFRPWSPVKYNPVLAGPQFIRLHPDFYIYSDVLHIEEFYRLSHLASIQAFQAREQHFLASMQAKTPVEVAADRRAR